MRIDPKQSVAVLFLLSGLVAMSSQAVGQETNTSADGDVPVLKLSWEAPTTRVNGSPLAADEIAGYEMQCQVDDAANGVVATSYEIPATVQAMPYEIDKAELFPEYGTYDCVLIVEATNGKRSQPSNAVTASWTDEALAEPAAPINFQVLTQ
jgi:hypothetical protein